MTSRKNLKIDLNFKQVLHGVVVITVENSRTHLSSHVEGGWPKINYEYTVRISSSTFYEF